MVDPFLMMLAFFHLGALVAGSFFLLKRLGLALKDMPFAVFVTVWATIVLGAHGASLVKGLDNLAIYVLGTGIGFAILTAIMIVLYRQSSTEIALVSPPALSFPEIQNKRTHLFLKRFLLISLGLIALGALAIGLGVYPDNADSMIYRLPRAFWYVSHGSFMHPFEAVDKRLTFYPLDGIALYVPVVLYNLTGNFFFIPSFIMWGLIVFAAFRFGRELGASRLIAFFVAWLVATTPSILAQSISTNDEILAAGSLLIALFLGWRWLVTGQRLSLFLGLTAAGLSIGTKMHVVYLAPVVLIALGLLVRHGLKNKGSFARWGDAIGGKTALWGGVSLVVMVVPFFFYNYASTGRFYYFDEFVGEVFNLSASLRGAFQNLLIYVSQMVLAPIADMNFWPVANTRQAFNNGLNAVFNPLIAPFLDPDPKYYHMHYRFTGITIPVSVRFVEFSLWSAFIWLLWPFQGVLAWRQKFNLRPAFFLLAMTPPLWVLIWSLTTLYMEGTATYFAYFLVIAAPAAVFSFAPILRQGWHEFRWIVIAFVTATNLLISFNLLMYSGFRALPDLFYAQSLPYDWDLVDASVIDEIRKAKEIRIALTHEKMPYFAYMHWNPRAKYYTPYPVKALPNARDVLQILPISSLYEYGFMPIKIPEKRTSGMTYIGTVRAIGREAIFATGNKVHERWPTESDYIILQALFVIDPDTQKWTLYIPPELPGLNPQDQLEVQYEVVQDGDVIHTSEWSQSPLLKLSVATPPNAARYAITTIIRSAVSGKELRRATYRISGSGAWLRDDREY